MSPSDLSLGWSSSPCLLGLGKAHHQETGRRLQSFGHAAPGVTCQVLFAIVCAQWCRSHVKLLPGTWLFVVVKYRSLDLSEQRVKSQCFTRAAIGDVLFSPYMAIFLGPESQGVFYVVEIHKWSHSLSQTCDVALKLTSLSLLLYPNHTSTGMVSDETLERHSFLFSQKHSMGWISPISLLYA